ncbi:hydrogenase nickel incorporation protein HypA/HybF [Lachnospiraceae bacterium NK3A20]|nr:hydrogenase nickel incorporation protein HypA/HybF [Lachnospiraceae bacterium NK3A20]
MHELPMVMELLSMMERKARENHLSKITEIDLRIGELSDLVDECIQLYFDTAAEGTCCEGAKLVFEKNPAILRCTKCGRQFPYARSFQCPDCGGSATLVRGTGTGFVVKQIKAL